MIKIGVFYDGNFLLHSSNYYNYVHSEKRRLSITGFHKFIHNHVAEILAVDSDKCRITQAHYFRGRLNASEAASRDNQLYNDRVFDDILMSEGIHTHYLPLRNVQGKKEERGIDVWLSLEVYEKALRKEIDIAVLIIADTDYTPMLRKVLSTGIPVMVIGWEFDYVAENGQYMVTRTSHELMNLATYPIAMQNVIEQGLADNDPIINNIFVPADGGSSSHSSGSAASVPTGEIENSEILSLKSGFGFIKYPNNNLFFHSLDVIGNFGELEVGDEVEFTIEKNAQGQDVAKNVKKL